MAPPASSWQQEPRDPLLASSQARGAVPADPRWGEEVFLLPVQGSHHNFLEVSEFIASGVLFSLRLTQRSEGAGGRERWLRGWRMTRKHLIFCRNKGEI